jgi:hypothetical protein
MPLRMKHPRHFPDEPKSGDPLGVPTRGAFLRVTLLRAAREMRYYGMKKQPAATLRMVAVDGSAIMFAAVLNSGLEEKIKHVKFVPGTNLVIYNWIWLDSSEWDQFKMVMLIHDFDFNLVPNKDTALDVDLHITKPDQFFVATKASDHVQNTNYVSHLEPTSGLLESNMIVWSLADTAMHNRHGDFILSDKAKQEYLICMKKKANNHCKKRRMDIRFTDDEEGGVPYKSCVSFDQQGNIFSCQCASRFALAECASLSVPIQVVNKELFLQVEDQLRGNVEAATFGELVVHHKRWALYWFYATNVLYLGGCTRTQLPYYLVRYIQETYPNKDGVEYVGFKEKGTASLNKKSKKKTKLSDDKENDSN